MLTAYLLQLTNEIYDTTQLLTGDVYKWLPESIKPYFRLIDKAIIQPGGDPQMLYSCDCFPEDQDSFEEIDDHSTIVRKKKHMVIQQMIQKLIATGAKNSLFLDEQDIQFTIAEDVDFKFAFRQAVDYYLIGKWEECHEYLKVCRELRPRDGPTIELYKYIQESNFKSTRVWEGYRDISDRVMILYRESK